MRGQLSRLASLARVWRDDPFEAAIALACLSALWGVRTGSGSGAAAKVLPHWALSAVDATSGLAGLLVLGGLATAGYSVLPVRQVLGRRFEQAGQLLISGLLLAVGVGAFSSGPAGTISGSVYCALAAAAAQRAAEIRHTFRAASPPGAVPRE